MADYAGIYADFRRRITGKFGPLEPLQAQRPFQATGQDLAQHLLWMCGKLAGVDNSSLLSRELGYMGQCMVELELISQAELNVLLSR